MKIINGGTPKSNVTSFWHGDIPWITPKDMGKLQTKYTSSTLRNITEDGLKNSSAKIYFFLSLDKHAVDAATLINDLFLIISSSQVLQIPLLSFVE